MNKSSHSHPVTDAPKTNTVPQSGSVRAQVSERTRALHETLHTNPVLMRLSSGDLTVPEYQAILEGYLAFYIAAESRRIALNALPGHSLMGDISLLSADTRVIPDALPRLHAIENEWACLGMLYVLHGARFGVQVMKTKLCAHLPDLPHYFFSQQPSPYHWRLIVVQMEGAARQTGDIELMAQSAGKTFAAFDKWMTNAV